MMRFLSNPGPLGDLGYNRSASTAAVLVLSSDSRAATRFTIDDDMRDLWRADFFLAASKVAAARRTLGDEVAGRIQRVLKDPLVIPAFKVARSDGSSQSAGT